MATLIDELIVRLNLDPSQFKKGTAEAERQTKHTQEAFKKSGEAMTRARSWTLPAMCSLRSSGSNPSGLGEFLRQVNQVQASLGRMAANFGVMRVPWTYGTRKSSWRAARWPGRRRRSTS